MLADDRAAIEVATEVARVPQALSLAFFVDRKVPAAVSEATGLVPRPAPQQPNSASAFVFARSDLGRTVPDRAGWLG